MQELTHEGIVPGTVVRARGERWHVHQARCFVNAAIVTLEGADESNRARQTTLLLPFDRLEPVPDRAVARRRRDRVVRGILHGAGCVRPAHGLWSARAARMDILPWQLAPALAVVGGATRLLLADAVGLGKTVQAGLVLAELRARGLADRALVLAPAAVRGHWADELGRRFDLPVRVLDLPALLELERSGPVGANPWSRTPIVVSSIDLVKRPEVCAAVEREPVDVLVVDEAHHATPGTDRHALVRRLARQVPWVVLASATPHSGDAAAYDALLALGEAPQARSPMRVFRRSHLDVHFQVPRQTCVLRVQPTAEEAALQSGVRAYVQALCRAPSGATPGVRLLASVLARRATSSPWAARLTLMRRLAGLIPAPGDEIVPRPLPWEESDPDEGDGPWLAAPGFANRADEQACLLVLIARADAALPCWSKLIRLQRFLRRVREPVIVFSEFRDTLEACGRGLDGVAPFALLHGGLDAVERHRRLQSFLDGRTQVLLTTDVAGEGLNLQQPSRLVITIEWPWNPVRIEQRIGRVHRLGQPRVVHAVHFTARESYEETVVARVMRRAARAADAFAGAGAGTEQQVSAEVLGVPDDRDAESGDGPRPAAVMDASVSAEARRLERARCLTAARQPIRSPAWTLPRRGVGSTRALVVVEVVDHLPSGWLRGSRLVPVAVTLREAPATRRAWRQVCRQICADPRVRQVAIDACPASHGEGQWAAVRARLAGLRRRRRTQSQPSLQPSLFDRRAIRESEQVDEVKARWDDWQSRLAARLAEGPVIHTARIVALLPMDAWAP
jgi:superfamily II DNA or RNA helicase